MVVAPTFQTGRYCLFIAGLGNHPYPGTRHSVGQHVIDALASRLGIRMRPDSKGFTGHGQVLIGRVYIDLTLYKPKALMNISGPPIVKAFRDSPCPPQPPNSLILLTDSLSHKPCTLSVKFGGSPEGHNGVKSVIGALGGKVDFWRFRLGIGSAREAGADAAQYVMQNLGAFEKRFWTDAFGGSGGEGVDLVLREIEKVAMKNGVV